MFTGLVQVLELWKDGTVMKAIPFESYEVFRSVCSSQAPAFDADLCSIVVNAVSYTHLDVYKRQALYRMQVLKVSWRCCSLSV